MINANNVNETKNKFNIITQWDCDNASY